MLGYTALPAFAQTMTVFPRDCPVRQIREREELVLATVLDTTSAPWREEGGDRLQATTVRVRINKTLRGPRSRAGTEIAYIIEAGITGTGHVWGTFAPSPDERMYLVLTRGRQMKLFWTEADFRDRERACAGYGETILGPRRPR